MERLFWLASLITLATGLNNTGFITVRQAAGGRTERLFADDGDGGADRGVLSAALLLCQRHGVYLCPRADDDCRRAGNAGNPATGLLPDGRRRHWPGSILTPYATGPSPIYYGSGYLPTVDYWRLGAIFGLIFLVLLVITGLIWMPLVLL